MSILNNQPSVIVNSTGMGFNTTSPTSSDALLSISSRASSEEISISDVRVKETLNTALQYDYTHVFTDIINDPDNTAKDALSLIDGDPVPNDDVILTLVQSEDEDSEMDYNILDYTASDDEFETFVYIHENKHETKLSAPADELLVNNVFENNNFNADRQLSINPDPSDISEVQNNLYPTTFEIEEVSGSDVNLHETHMSSLTPSSRLDESTHELVENNTSENSLSDDGQLSITPDRLDISEFQDNLLPTTSEIEEVSDSEVNLYETHISSITTPSQA